MIVFLIFLAGCVTMVVLAFLFDDDVSDLFKAITERIRHPKPSMLEEVHRHWEESDRIQKSLFYPNGQCPGCGHGLNEKQTCINKDCPRSPMYQESET